MALVRWSPETELTGGFNSLQQRQFLPLYNPLMNPLMAHYPVSPLEQPFFGSVLPIDVIDQKNEFIVKAEIPGVNPNDLKIMVANNIVTIRGERLLEREARSENYFWTERPTGVVQRSITLPVPVEPNEVSALYDNGILTISLPKSRNVTSVEIDVQNGLGFGKQSTVRTTSSPTGIHKTGKRNRSRVH